MRAHRPQPDCCEKRKTFVSAHPFKADPTDPRQIDIEDGRPKKKGFRFGTARRGTGSHWSPQPGRPAVICQQRGLPRLGAVDHQITRARVPRRRPHPAFRD